MNWAKIILALLALPAALSAAGCTSPGTGLPAWAGGEPAGLPAPPATPTSYPDVHDMPPPRATKPMSEAEQARIEGELTALRNRINAEGEAAQHGRPAGPGH